MNDDSLLTGCTLTGAWHSHAADFAPLCASLHYQAEKLGLETPVSDLFEAINTLNFEFSTPQSQPVLCEISRWDDQNCQTPLTEFTLQAACGVMSVHGRASGKAQALGVPYLSTIAATLALQGAMAATIGQLRGLPLTRSHISLAAAGLLSVGQYLAGATAEEAPEQLLPAMIAQPASPPFISADGVVFELEALDAAPWQKFWTALGVSSQLAGKAWSAFVLRYAKAIAPLPSELPDTLSRLDYARIVEFCAKSGMAICPVRKLSDRAGDDDYQSVLQQGPWRFDRSDMTSDAPLKPANTDLPLSGLTVIESCRRIQGPLAGHLLSLLGAKVIRIEPIGGDPLRGMPPMANGCSARFDALNRHKTVREIDIKSPAGKAEIYDLVRDADVFLHNWAAGKATPLQLAPADLLAIQPQLIYAYAGGWADDDAAVPPTHTRLGTDFMTQAYSGIGKTIGAASDTAGGSLFTVLDVLGGVVAAQAVTASLLQRCLKKTGSTVTSSLMSAATLLTFGATASTDDKHSVVCQTLQGLLSIDSSPVALCAALNLSDDSLIEQTLLQKTAKQWAQDLAEQGIACAVVIEDLSELPKQTLLQTGLESDSYTKVVSPWRFT